MRYEAFANYGFDDELISKTIKPIGGRKKNYIENLLSKAKKKAFLRSNNWCAVFFKFTKMAFEYVANSSFFIFHKEGYFKKLCININQSMWFNYFNYFVIFVSTITILIENPWIDSKSTLSKTLNIMNIVFTVIFTFEMLVKSIANDFILRFDKKVTKTEDEWNKDIISKQKTIQKSQTNINTLAKSIVKSYSNDENEDPYLTYISNMIDLFVITIGWIEMFGSFNTSLSFIKVLRILRSLRPLRIITKSESLKIIVSCCLKSIPAMGHVFILWAVFVLIYATLGVNLFKDDLYYVCENFEFTNEEDCLKAGHKWHENKESFINFLVAFKTLFQLMNGEQWNTLTYRSKVYSTNWLVYLFFLSYLIIGFFFILNLLISVVVQKFKTLKDRQNNVNFLRDEEVDWVKVQKIMMKFRPKKINKDKQKNLMVSIVNHVIFEYIILFAIFLSVVVLAMTYNGASLDYILTLEIINYFLIGFFNIEMILKLMAYKHLYFKSGWNIFDFIIVTVTDVILALSLFSGLNGNISSNSLTIPVIIRCFRVFRILRVITSYSKLRSLIDSLVYLVPSVGNIGSLLLIVFFIFGAFGMNIFGTVPERNFITYNNNFNNIFSSVLILFRTCTGEGWNYIMEEISYHNCTIPGSLDYISDPMCVQFGGVCMEELPTYEDLEKGLRYCGSYAAYFYFIFFIVVTPLFIMNLCVVLVIEGFSESMYENESLLSQEMMDIFVNTWIKYDPECKLSIKPYEFVLIMKEMCPPLGFNYDGYYVIDPHKQSERRKRLLTYKNLHLKKKNNLISNLEIDLNLLNNYCSHKANNNSFDFNGFYTNKDFRFFTNDLEIIRFLSKFDFYDNVIKKENSIEFEDMQIKFVDACINLSRMVISRKHKISQQKLRQDIVKDLTLNMWVELYAEEKENAEKKVKLVEKIAIQIINKVKPFLYEKLKKIRQNLKRRKDNQDCVRRRRTNLQSIDIKKSDNFLGGNFNNYDDEYINFNVSNVERSPSDFSFVQKPNNHTQMLSEKLNK